MTRGRPAEHGIGEVAPGRSGKHVAADGLSVERHPDLAGVHDNHRLGGRQRRWHDGLGELDVLVGRPLQQVHGRSQTLLEVQDVARGRVRTAQRTAPTAHRGHLITSV